MRLLATRRPETRLIPARAGRTAGGNHHGLVVPGLIPARAGRTSDGPGGCGGQKAHPRSRGADATATGAVTVTHGSSPLARGGLADMRTYIALLRLIPARAGRTTSSATTPGNSRAHPRSRGADMLPMARPTRVVGSSPLARGGHGTGEGEHVGDGLIPARAGRTHPEAEHMSTTGAHPRSRGAD